MKDQEHSDGRSHHRSDRHEASQRISGQSGARRSTPRGKGSRRPADQGQPKNADGLREPRRSSRRQAGEDAREAAGTQAPDSSRQHHPDDRGKRRRRDGAGSQRPRVSRDQRTRVSREASSSLRVIPGGKLEGDGRQEREKPATPANQGVKDGLEASEATRNPSAQTPASQRQTAVREEAGVQAAAAEDRQVQADDGGKARKEAPDSSQKPQQASRRKGLFPFGRKRHGQTGTDQRKSRADRVSQKGEDGAGHGEHKVRRGVVKTIVAMLAAVLVAGVAVVILSTTPLFTIKHIDVVPCDHISREQVLKLAQVGPKATLLNYDADRIEEALKKNPWVKSVKLSRDFPDTLRIQIQEHKVSAICLIGPENVGWYLSDDGHWIEPVKFEASADTSIKDVALTLAQKQHCLLIYDLPLSCQPKAGRSATDKQIQAVMKFVHGFSADFTSQIVSFSAPSANGISCVLKSGVQISLGAPEDIDEKQLAIQAILSRHKNQVTYINVRAADAPVYRKVGVTPTQAGSGVDSGQAVKDPASKNGSDQAVPDGTNPADKKFTDNAQG